MIWVFLIIAGQVKPITVSSSTPFKTHVLCVSLHVSQRDKRSLWASQWALYLSLPWSSVPSTAQFVYKWTNALIFNIGGGGRGLLCVTLCMCFIQQTAGPGSGHKNDHFDKQQAVNKYVILVENMNPFYVTFSCFTVAQTISVAKETPADLTHRLIRSPTRLTGPVRKLTLMTLLCSSSTHRVQI